MTLKKVPSSRIIAVDFARVLAILFMVQGHTLDVLLVPAARQGFFFDKWLFLRGLTAPMFLTLSGASFAIATMRRWDSHIQISSAFWKRTRRFLFFVFLGYVMHLPMKSFRNISFANSAGWQNWLQVDVLQCIGISLCLLQLLVLAAKTPSRFAKLAVGSGFLAILITPLMWKFGWAHVPLFLSSYFNGNAGSLFPLFPWMGYIFCGVGLGYLYHRRQQSDVSPVLPILLIGSLAMAAGFIFNHIPITIYSNIDYWKTSPNLFLSRMGYVCMILAGLTYLTQKISLPQRTVQSIAQESLTIYIIHICILYGSSWNMGLRQLIGPTLNFLPTMEWITLLLITMTTMGFLWNRFKHAEPAKTLWLQSAAVLLIAYSLT